jgi:hypothetical protein
MRIILCAAFFLSTIHGVAQDSRTEGQTQKSPDTQAQSSARVPQPDSSDIGQLQRDVQQLRVLVIQMRNNLAFVQTSQTPLKHQFELEADAWQILIDQMDRRLKTMQDRNASTTPQK